MGDRGRRVIVAPPSWLETWDLDEPELFLVRPGLSLLFFVLLVLDGSYTCSAGR